MNAIPDLRIRIANPGAPNSAGRYVLYWMIAARRTRHNFALERAVAWAVELGLPLLVFEPLRAAYPWASDRLHRWVIDGMADNAARFEELGVAYYPYVEPELGAGRGLLSALAERAALVVTDEFPAFFLPRMVRSAARQVRVPIELVDANGIMPLRAPDKVFVTARSFRFFFQRHARSFLEAVPKADPVARARLAGKAEIALAVTKRWPRASAALLRGDAGTLDGVRIDHSVGIVEERGGQVAGLARLDRFLAQKLGAYDEARNHPDDDAQSGLSPYLHFGHVGAHEVLARIAKRDGFDMGQLSPKITGLREGFWGMSAEAEAFLDQLVTWRELGFNMCALRPNDYDRYESLPSWALATLAKHAKDRRPAIYDRERLAAGETSDALWNAAQKQLLREGRIHNYLRMLWGKRVLEWSRTPQEALDVLIDLNNRYAVDGRDPNSYSGIFWTFGRYDRPWAPERPIFGTVRFMTSASAAKKLHLKKYLARYGGAPLPAQATLW